MSAEMIEFAVNGTSARGYLATPESGAGPGVIVLQEWWGLVPPNQDGVRSPGRRRLYRSCTRSVSR